MARRLKTGKQSDVAQWKLLAARAVIRTFAANAKSNGERENSGRSGHKPVFCCAKATKDHNEPSLLNAAVLTDNRIQGCSQH